jgi:hypothetical protein
MELHLGTSVITINDKEEYTNRFTEQQQHLSHTFCVIESYSHHKLSLNESQDRSFMTKLRSSLDSSHHYSISRLEIDHHRMPHTYAITRFNDIFSHSSLSDIITELNRTPSLFMNELVISFTWSSQYINGHLEHIIHAITNYKNVSVHSYFDNDERKSHLRSVESTAGNILKISTLFNY